MNIDLSRRGFLQSALASACAWMAKPFLPSHPPAPAPRPAVLLPEEMDPERLAVWKRSARRPVLASDDPTISRILLAIREEREIVFRYGWSPSDDPRRTICPGAVFTVDGFEATYVSGYCFSRKQERTFCIERLILC